MVNDTDSHKLALKRLRDGTELVYFCNGKIHLEGLKKSDGIMCLCCNTVVSASRFEVHAGYGLRKKPFSYIYVTSKNVTLHELSVSSNGDSEHDQNNDDESVITNENDQMDPVQGEHVNDVAREEVQGQEIAPEADEELTACVLCRGTDFLKPPAFGPLTIMLCDQCDREYHVGCLQEHKMADLQLKPESDWFCSLDCATINAVLKYRCGEGDISLHEFLDVRVRPPMFESIKLRFINSSVDTLQSRALVSDAVDVLRDGFHGLADLQDLFPSLVMGLGQEYRGMLCSALIVNSVVVAVAVYRVFSVDVAELPLVATIRRCRNRGYFKLMFAYLENLLSSLKVKRLVLPATDRAQSMWENFGFRRMQDEAVSQILKSYPSLILFKDTVMLSKCISNPPL